MKVKFKEMMILNWKVWIPANFINFTFVPIPYQVLYSNVISLGFNVGISYIAYRKIED